MRYKKEPKDNSDKGNSGIKGELGAERMGYCF